MRILVAGRTGQLARALAEQSRSQPHAAATVLGRPELDLLDQSSIERAFSAARPSLIVNAAAYTAVDKAESDAPAAFAVNRDGAAALAATAHARGVPIVHVSTDYVFDGSKAGPYVEDDATCPAGVYGQSKLEGEQAVASSNPRHVILRTAWVYSPFGHNFLKTMVRLAAERAQLRVVADQHGNPTYAHHLADAILALAGQLQREGDAQRWGVFHAAAGGETTWHGFAETIIATASTSLGLPRVPVLPIATAEYPTPARRPANSVLDCAKLERVFGLRLPSWQQGVEACIARLALDIELASRAT